tara:strand:+ start:1418 stop:2473 length:1056 start_codon:yes stop_codon:yes gene_type:complete
MISIDGTKIGSEHQPYIIAELSANHGGSLQRAKQSIEAAKKSGANAVKIQTYTPDTMTIDSNEEDFLIKEGLWKGTNLYELYKQAYTPYEWHKELFRFASEIGMTIFSSPFDESAVDLLEELNTPAYKIASFEITDLPLIEYAAKNKKPILISTGMASVDEIAAAIESCKSVGNDQILLFHCISSYPVDVSDSKLNNILYLMKEFRLDVGLSDHTVDNTAAIIAISLGARVIEKHFKLDKKECGPDSSFSILPDQLQKLVSDCKSAHLAVSDDKFSRAEVELPNIKFRRSLYFSNNIKVGEIITKEKIKRVRPGYGLDPSKYNMVLGSICTKNAKKGDRVTVDHFTKKGSS